MGLQIRILIVVLMVLLTGCVNKPQPVIEKRIYSNNFTTLEIRSYWTLCQQAFLEKNPYTPVPVLIKHCDCYSDYVRRTYKDVKELEYKSVDSFNNLTKNLIIECNMKLQQEQALADPASL